MRRAGGVLATRHGRPVVVSHGSAAGELAACVSAVGVADCSQLTKLALDGPAPLMQALTRRLASTELAPGGTVATEQTWWCAPTATQIVVLGEPDGGSAGGGRLWARVRAAAAEYPEVAVTDHTAGWATLAVVGRRAPELLASLGVYGSSGDPRRAAPVAMRRVGSTSGLWLLCSDTRALAALPRAAAPALWRTIERAGRALGICAVGQEALARYELIRPSTGL